MKRKGTLVAAAAGLLLSSIGVAAAPLGLGAVHAAEAPDATGRRIDPADITAATLDSKQVKIELADHPGEHVYLVRFAQPAAPEYIRSKAQLAEVAFDGNKLNATSAPVRAYVAELESAHDAFVQTARTTIGRTPEVVFDYTYAVNGMAIRLNAAEVRALSKTPGIVSIRPDVEREIQTDSGPTWINADAAWNADPDLGLPADYLGEGMVIGVIDTGISPLNPSFAAVGADGYPHVNPLGEGNYLGICATLDEEDQLCNDKLIGIWDHRNQGDGGIDYDGHGSHTASTSGGNFVEGVDIGTGDFFDISGVAPHANIVSYLGCCTVSGLTGSIDQAIADEVDVINYSIGSSSASALWDDFDSVGYLNARDSGIFVATSAGNDGPGSATVGSPGDAPWLTSVGATTHNRWNGNSLENLTSSEGTLDNIIGKGVTDGLPATEIVFAGDDGDPNCLDLAPGQPIPPGDEGAPGNPVADHSDAWEGKIVVCLRGGNGRVQKSRNVDWHGGVGFVLVNDPGNAGPGALVGDAFAIPGVAITNTDGADLIDWLATGEDHTAEIGGVNYITGEDGEAYADILASFSSRGPNRAIDTIAPSLTAPGVDILAAYTDTEADDGGIEFGVVSGTSMASPHVAGAGALIMQARPDWTPAEIQSAMMTTAHPVVSNNDLAPATPYQQGNGRIDVGAAISAGLVFDESTANYEAANPDTGGDPRTLNLPSFANTQCLGICSWTRAATVPDDGPAGVSWTASVDADPDIDVDVVLSTTDPLAPGADLTITVTADVTAATEGDTYFARITLTPDDGDVPAATLPLAVVPTGQILPASAEFDTRRNAGSDMVTGLMSGEVTDLTGTIAWTAGTSEDATIVQDPTPGPFGEGVYNGDGGINVTLVDVPAGTRLFHAATSNAAAPDLDMFVGTGDTPSAATEVCASGNSGSNELCQIIDPAPGQYWIVVHSYEGTDETTADPYTLTYATVAPGDNGTGTVEGPAGTVPAGTPYDVTITWNLPDAVAGDVYFGIATLDDVGEFPVTLNRHDDDVAKEASVTEATFGDEIDYTITIQPNITANDLEYTITDTVPDGFTIDAASVTGGGVVDGQTITWTLVQPAATGAGTYVVQTMTTHPDTCGHQFGSTFYDLGPEGHGFAYAFSGDEVSGTAFGDIGPFPLWGTSVGNLGLSENGFVSMPAGLDGDLWWIQELPDSEAPNGVFAAFWDDFITDATDGSGVVLADIGVAAIVQWDNPYEWAPVVDTTPLGKFQAWVYNYIDPDFPEIVYEYAPGDGTFENFVTVGAENLAGDEAAVFANWGDPDDIIAEEVVCLDWQTATADAVELGYTVTVDDGIASGTYTNVAEHITDNFADAVAEATADVEVDATAPTPVVTAEFDTTNQSTVTFTVAFDEDVTGFDDAATDLVVAGTAGATTGTITEVDAANYTVEVTAPGDGTVTVSVPAGAAEDAAGNASVESNEATTTIDTTIVDEESPTVEVTAAEDSVPVGSDVVFTVTFSEPVSGFSADGLTVTGTDVEPVITGSSPEYTVTFPAVGEAGTVTLTVDAGAASDAAGNPSVASDPVSVEVTDSPEPPAESVIVPIEPGRYWDTRDEFETLDHEFEATGRMAADTTFEVQVAGRPGVPDDATGIVANLTAILPDGPGHATIYPCGEAVPNVSAANYVPGDILANNVVVPLSDDGKVCVYTYSAVDFALDVNGYIDADAPETAIEPARYLDTRDGFETFDHESEGGGAVAAESVTRVQIAGRGDVPEGATAAMVNLTVALPDANGFLTAYPCTDEVPWASTVNYLAGQTVPNGGVVPLSADGELCIYSLTAAHIILDVTGFIPGDVSSIVPVEPARLFDSRPGEDLIDGTSTGPRLEARQTVKVQVTGRHDIPDTATAAFLNVAMVLPDGPTFVTLFACDDPATAVPPNASNLNLVTGGLRANNALTALSDDGSVCIYTYEGADVLLDITGYINGPASDT